MHCGPPTVPRSPPPCTTRPTRRTRSSRTVLATPMTRPRAPAPRTCCPATRITRFADRPTASLDRHHRAADLTQRSADRHRQSLDLHQRTAHRARETRSLIRTITPTRSTRPPIIRTSDTLTAAVSPDPPPPRAAPAPPARRPAPELSSRAHALPALAPRTHRRASPFPASYTDTRAPAPAVRAPFRLDPLTAPPRTALRARDPRRLGSILRRHPTEVLAICTTEPRTCTRQLRIATNPTSIALRGAVHRSHSVDRPVHHLAPTAIIPWPVRPSLTVTMLAIAAELHHVHRHPLHARRFYEYEPPPTAN
jgi:hypothetical protein